MPDVVDEKKVEDKVLMGLVIEDGKMVLKIDTDAPPSEFVRYWGILSLEMPFMLQHLKAMKQKAEKSIITPN